jgi:hypothetical protein
MSRFLHWTSPREKPAKKKLSPLVPADALRPATERYSASTPGHRGKNRRDEYLIMKESDIMGVVVEAKAHKSAA